MNDAAYRRTLGRTAGVEFIVVALLPRTTISVYPSVYPQWENVVQWESRNDCDLGQKGKSSEFNRELHRGGKNVEEDWLKELCSVGR